MFAHRFGGSGDAGVDFGRGTKWGRAIRIAGHLDPDLCRNQSVSDLVCFCVARKEQVLTATWKGQSAGKLESSWKEGRHREGTRLRSFSSFCSASQKESVPTSNV